MLYLGPNHMPNSKTNLVNFLPALAHPGLPLALSRTNTRQIFQRVSIGFIEGPAQMHIKTEMMIVQSMSNPKMQAAIVAKDATKVGADDLEGEVGAATGAGHTVSAGDAVEEDAPPVAERVS